MSYDGTTFHTETRYCEAICPNEHTVHIPGKQEDVNQAFEGAGWSGYFCPAHRHLNRRRPSRGPEKH